jgi:hypothetical protein
LNKQERGKEFTALKLSRDIPNNGFSAAQHVRLSLTGADTQAAL